MVFNCDFHIYFIFSDLIRDHIITLSVDKTMPADTGEIDVIIQELKQELLWPLSGWNTICDMIYGHSKLG